MKNWIVRAGIAENPKTPLKTLKSYCFLSSCFFKAFISLFSISFAACIGNFDKCLIFEPSFIKKSTSLSVVLNKKVESKDCSLFFLKAQEN